MREMRVEGAFAASLDADQDGEEGASYVWTEDEVDAALGPAAPPFKAAYDVTRRGNWEGRTVLRRIAPRGSAEEEAGLAAARAALLALRQQRARPARDDKVLADWNGLAIAALVRASAVFDQPEWLATARSTFDFVMTTLSDAGGRLLHAWRAGRAGAPGRLDDTAAMARAAIALFEATGDPGVLAAAERLAAETLDRFGDGAGGVFLTAGDADDIPGARPRHAHDGAVPSGAGLLAEVFARLWHLTAEPRWREAADALIRAFSGAPEGIGGSPLLLLAADMLERGGCVVIEGAVEDSVAAALAAGALRASDPGLTVFRLDRNFWSGGAPRSDLPRSESPVALLCRGHMCSLPVATPDGLSQLIAGGSG